MGAALDISEDERLSETVTLASGADPARRLERALWKPTADGPALPAVRQPGPGRQVTWTTGREGGQKGPQGGRGSDGAGGRGLGAKRRAHAGAAQASEHWAWGVGEVRVHLTGPRAHRSSEGAVGRPRG